MVVSIGTCSEAGGTMGKETEIAPYRYGDGTGYSLISVEARMSRVSRIVLRIPIPRDIEHAGISIRGWHGDIP